MASELRKTGISILGDMPWGTHFCHFYETKQDLLDILVPYFKVGLENNEFCLWVISDSELITMEEAKAALAQAVPNFDKHLAEGNIEILDGLDWYLEKNVFNLEKVTTAWNAKLKSALAHGYEGMRVSGDTLWLTEKDWKDFSAYEKHLNDFFTERRITLLCTYSLSKSGAAAVLDVLDAHQFGIARRQGEWQVIQRPESRQARAEVKRLNAELQRIVKTTPQPPLVLRYGVAVLAVIAALIINRLLHINLVGAPAMLFLCALMFSAWYGGVKPSLVALPLAALAFAYYFVTPMNSWTIDVREIPRLSLFVLSALFVISLSAAQKRAAESLRQARDVLAGTVEELKRTNQALRTENAERKQAEEALNESQRKLEEAQHIAHVGHWERDLQTGLITWSDEIYRILGLPLQKTRTEWEDMLHPEDRERVSLVIEEAQRGIRSYDVEYRIVRPDGEVRFLHSQGDIIRDEQGQPTRAFGVAQDITERKQAEAALDERLRFETLLTELSAAFANLSPGEVDPEIDKWLKTLVEFLGVDRASFLQFGEDWTTLYRSHSYTVPGIEPLPPPPFVLKDQFPWITDQLRRGVTVKWARIPDDMSEEAVKEKEYAARLGVKSGLNIPVRIGGSVICAITFTSITAYRDWPEAMVPRLRLVGEIFAAAIERKRAQEELKKEKEILEKIFHNIPVMIGFVGDDGAVKLVNPEWERSIGWTVKELEEQKVDIFAEAYPDPAYRQQVLDFVAASTGEWVDLKIKVRDGRVIDAACAVVHLSDGTRVAIAQDITERKSAEERIRATSEQLRALSARLQSAKEEEDIRIAREIHDEMGSALTSLRWELETFDKTISEANDWSQLQALRAKIEDMMRLTDLIIGTMRRIASELRPSILDDLGLVAAIEWQAQQFQLRTGIECRCDCSLEDVELNEEQSTAVFRIFQEALTNILRHAQATRVDIEMNKEDGYFILSVSDNGKGITEMEKSEQHSLGILGMRERAHLIGGEIDIQAVEQHGTVVTVRVPILSQEPVEDVAIVESQNPDSASPNDRP